MRVHTASSRLAVAGLHHGALHASCGGTYKHASIPKSYQPMHRGNVMCEAHAKPVPSEGLVADPKMWDKDECGVGFVGELSKQPSRKCITDAIEMLVRMAHRGACGCEENTGSSCALTSSLPARAPCSPAGYMPSHSESFISSGMRSGLDGAEKMCARWTTCSGALQCGEPYCAILRFQERPE